MDISRGLYCPEPPEMEGSYVLAWKVLEDKNASRGTHWPGSVEFWIYTHFLCVCDFSHYLGPAFVTAVYETLPLAPLVAIHCPLLCLTL